MPTSEPLHVAFVWHMHQPYYRSARTGSFDMPWARMHALKDYLDMVEMLSAFPALHHTFNLVPSLVEQLQDYASGDFTDLYWEHTLKPAALLTPAEQAFVVERMCERSDHPRAHLHPRYLELARKREANALPDWQACAATFTIDEIRDLQVWFNLAWFDPSTLGADALRGLVEKGRDFCEDDKQVLAAVQADILARVLPAYRDAACRGQVELSTSPYFHPILPLLCNTDSARIASPDILLPPRRFAHPPDAAEQVKTALHKHVRVFGEQPRGMWCSEQAVGEDIVPLLIEAGVAWTISDETVLVRSVSGAAPSASRTGPAASPGSPSARSGAEPATPSATVAVASPAGPSATLAELVRGPASPYFPYRLVRDEGEIAIVFRDHTLSDLIGFTYRSWDSRDAAADLIRRLHELRDALLPTAGAAAGTTQGAGARPLVTIALDGENAWEYYPHDGRDFLQYLYEGLSTDDSVRCVTVSEHLRLSPPARSLEWLHTGSWIGGDLGTWCGDKAHGAAWEYLGTARDMVARHRRGAAGAGTLRDGWPAPDCGAGSSLEAVPPATALDEAWRHILIAEGSDWFWWFGDHHHTDLDDVWDHEFRLHLQEAYRCVGETIPAGLFLPLLDRASSQRATLPLGPLSPGFDGLLADPAEWEPAGFLAPELPSTMQRSNVTSIQAVRFGWQGDHLCLLVVPGPSPLTAGLEIEVRVACSGDGDDVAARLTLEESGRVGVSFAGRPDGPEGIRAAWNEVVEIGLPLSPAATAGSGPVPPVGAAAVTGTGSSLPAARWSALLVGIGRDGATEHVFHSTGLAMLGGEGQ